MDLEEAEQWLNSNELVQQKWDYCIGIDPAFQELNPPSLPRDTEMRGEGVAEWDPKTMLSNLCFLEQKIRQLQDLVHLMVGRRSQAILGPQEELAAQQQQQLVTADVTSIIAQLISTAGSLLPSVTTAAAVTGQPVVADVNSVAEQRQHNNNNNNNNIINKNNLLEDHELKDEEDVDEGENLVPGTYEILQLEKEEILAPHTHFCAICGKGFKRDANLRMHMRGHGDEYKTPAALAKPHKESGSEPLVTKRYSCPFGGCKRNKEHKKFQPLKTILCVKNHYKRTHCDKSYTCSRCKTKKFSVIADLKTHEKHCGKDKWLCSCGTTFSRKDKLFGHISLFQGHTPAIPVDETKASETKNIKGSASSANFNFGSTSQTDVDVKEGLDDPSGFFSPMNFENCNFGGFHEFPRPPYEEDSESSFSFLLPGSCNYPHKTVGESTTSNLE